jgi:hypothetical protein
MAQRQPTRDEMSAYLRERAYVSGVHAGWSEMTPGRWVFFPKDRRRRASDDFSLEMAYEYAIRGRFDAT